jgi:inorganic pyrophosphatase
MEYDNKFWEYLNRLVKENEIIIDRPKGTKHPRYNEGNNDRKICIDK